MKNFRSYNTEECEIIPPHTLSHSLSDRPSLPLSLYNCISLLSSCFSVQTAARTDKNVRRSRVNEKARTAFSSSSSSSPRRPERAHAAARRICNTVRIVYIVEEGWRNLPRVVALLLRGVIASLYIHEYNNVL